MKRSLTILLTLIAILAMAIPGTAQTIPDGEEPIVAGQSEKVVTSGNYIIEMANAPVIDYKGGVAGFRATASNGKKIDPGNRYVKKYVTYLDKTHNGALARVGGQKLYDYHYTFNGFAAKLTPAQAEQMKQQPGVISVTADEMLYADTVTTPYFLGLAGAGGLWETLGGTDMAGRNIVVGVVDSGIWPENPSFAWTDSLGTYPFPQWAGRCASGENWTPDLCNGKIIGARYFNASWGGDAGIDAQRPWEFNSPRDYNGHGSHTSSTAAGNPGVDATLPNGDSLGQISGMAPSARIATYKALWSLQDGSQASGFTADLVAAIDQAVADGVDVINYSISGSTTTNTGAVDLAFMRAARAGIFVAVSAGNSGPTASTVAHNHPWVTTVAAGTHDRAYPATVTLGNSAVYAGVSLGSGTPMLPVILSTSAGLPGADPTMVRLCYSSVSAGAPVLDPTLIAGKIVVCDRGVTARVDKSFAVMEGGGLGVILANTSPNSLNADLHSIPTVHVDEIAGAAIKAYVNADPANATAQLSPGLPTLGALAPDVAAFSSRGPARAASGNLLKPDIMAPGVDVLAAVSPASGGGFNYNFYSGTSMSSPHIAGIAALFKGAFPSWTPMMIKSALMTTASQMRNNGTSIPGGSFAYGAGQVQPKSAFDPGLVYDSRMTDWLGYLCGTGQFYGSRCNGLVVNPNDFNSPSIAISSMAGQRTVTRSVKSVGVLKEVYSASIVGLAGIDVTVSPASFTIKPGQTIKYQVSFTRTSATLNAYTEGFLVLTGDKGHVVKIPVVIRPVALAAPAALYGNGSPISYNVTFGYDGLFTATARGLVPAVITAGTVADDPTDSTCSLASPNAVLVPVTIAAGTTYARFSLFDADVNPGSDIDLCVFRGSTLVGSSGSGTSAEEVNLLNPTAANYTVVVQGWGVAGSSPFKLHTWLLGTADAGNMIVSAPATAVTAATGTINLAFAGLTPGTKYLGSVAYAGAAGMPNPTIVFVAVP